MYFGYVKNTNRNASLKLLILNKLIQSEKSFRLKLKSVNVTKVTDIASNTVLVLGRKLNNTFNYDVKSLYF